VIPNTTQKVSIVPSFVIPNTTQKVSIVPWELTKHTANKSLRTVLIHTLGYHFIRVLNQLSLQIIHQFVDLRSRDTVFVVKAGLKQEQCGFLRA